MLTSIKRIVRRLTHEPAGVAIAAEEPASYAIAADEPPGGPAPQTGQTSSQPEPPRVSPITEIPFPKVDLAAVVNPIGPICDAAEFDLSGKFFASSPSATRSLLSEQSQALLYAIIRNLRPDHVVEIGTYQAGTSESVARALHANGTGMLHTASPHDDERVRAVMPYWPEELRRHTRYYQMDSMALFMQLDAESIRPSVVLIDGNHDYEFANFDIQASARRITPGGFLFVDNVSQAGPYFAATDFLASHPEWVNCTFKETVRYETKAFVPGRSDIPHTDFFVLRSPEFDTVGSRAVTFGEIPWSGKPVSGVDLSLRNSPGAGTLQVQCIFRAFSEVRNVEIIAEASTPVDSGRAHIKVPFAEPMTADGEFNRYAVEVWLMWLGSGSLALRQIPLPY